VVNCNGRRRKKKGNGMAADRGIWLIMLVFGCGEKRRGDERCLG
jgi:hypothetical protein